MAARTGRAAAWASATVLGAALVVGSGTALGATWPGERLASQTTFSSMQTSGSGESGAYPHHVRLAAWTGDDLQTGRSLLDFSRSGGEMIVMNGGVPLVAHAAEVANAAEVVLPVAESAAAEIPLWLRIAELTI